jgi:hypothetical protein
MSESNNTETVVVAEQQQSTEAAPVANVLNNDEPVVTQVDNTSETKAAEVKTEANLLDIVPKEYKAFIEKKGFKDMGSVLKSLENLESKLGKRFEDMTPEDIKAINKKLGVPEKVEDYGIKLEDSMKDHPILSKVGEDLLQAGVPKDQANKLLESVLKRVKAEDDRFAADYKIQSEKEIETIKKEFGSAFQERVGLANMALKHFGKDEVTKVLQESGLANNPSIVKMFAEIGKIISEDGTIRTQGSGNFGMTPSEAREKLAEFRQEHGKALNTPNHPDHKWAVEENFRLHKLSSK